MVPDIYHVVRRSQWPARISAHSKLVTDLEGGDVLHNVLARVVGLASVDAQDTDTRVEVATSLIFHLRQRRAAYVGHAVTTSDIDTRMAGTITEIDVYVQRHLDRVEDDGSHRWSASDDVVKVRLRIHRDSTSRSRS